MVFNAKVRVGGTGGAVGAAPVFLGKDTKITLKFALSVVAIYRAPPDFSTLRRPCTYYLVPRSSPWHSLDRGIVSVGSVEIADGTHWNPCKKLEFKYWEPTD